MQDDGMLSSKRYHYVYEQFGDLYVLSAGTSLCRASQPTQVNFVPSCDAQNSCLPMCRLICSLLTVESREPFDSEQENFDLLLPYVGVCWEYRSWLNLKLLDYPYSGAVITLLLSSEFPIRTGGF